MNPRKPKYDPVAHGANCDACPLRGTQVVAPEGDIENAALMFIGESPGFQELKNGRPFHGPSGLKLNEMLYFAKLKRDQVYVTNATLCRPVIPEGEGVDGAKRFEAKSYRAWLRAKNARMAKAAKARGAEPEVIADPWVCCAPRLWGELHVFERAALARGQPNGGVVMPLGNFALKTIIGREGVLKLRGSPLVVDMNDPYKTDADRTRDLAGPDPEGLTMQEENE